MIQEVLSTFMEEPKTPSTQAMNPSSPLSSPSLSTSSPSLTNHPPPQEPLRCPRCDSTNTKFCYYNNYNLTQPRHFCKTCRRYWTKGGALRNVPIGGGCRKAKVVPTICTKSNGTKTKSGIGAHELAPGPITWAAPHTAQLMALLRATNCMQNPNPSLGLNMTSPALPNLLNGLDNLYVHGNQFSNYPMQQRYQNNMLQGEQLSGPGTQDMFQRFKTSIFNDQLQSVVGNVGGFGSSPSMAMATGMATHGVNVATSLMDPAPLNTSELAYDLQAINGVYP